MERKKILLIVDAQNDFINGSMTVFGAEDKMNALAKYIGEHKDEYDFIILTADWHPINHCSFIENGGEWPMHCVAHTIGAAIYQPIINTLIENKIPFEILTKGEFSNKEEYSIMESYASSKKLMRTIFLKGNPTIDVCGIANEYCVLNTVKDLTEKNNLGEKLNILFDFVAAINDDSVLKKYAEEKNIKM